MKSIEDYELERAEQIAAEAMEFLSKLLGEEKNPDVARFAAESIIGNLHSNNLIMLLNNKMTKGSTRAYSGERTEHLDKLCWAVTSDYKKLS